MKNEEKNNDFVTVKIYKSDLVEMFQDRFNVVWSERYSFDECNLYLDALEEIVENGSIKENEFFNVSEIVDNFVINDTRILRPEDCDYSENVERIENGDRYSYGEAETEDGTVYLISRR